MVTISIDKFVEMMFKNNGDMSKEELTASLKKSLAAKHAGATCIQCGAPIWAAGSAISGTNMCFTCMTGEGDSSGDYEIC